MSTSEIGCSVNSQRYRGYRPADRRPRERPLRDIQRADVEVGPIAEHRARDAGEPVRDGDGGHLVAPLRTELGEVRVERMGRAARMMSPSQSIARSSPEPRVVMGPYASRSPE